MKHLPVRKNLFLILLLLFVTYFALSLPGCGSGSGDSSGSFDENTTLSGRVVTSVGGPPAVGAVVTATQQDGLSYTAVTDSSGEFSISLPAGTCRVQAEKSGMAVSVIEDVEVSGPEEVGIILPPVFNSQLTVTAMEMSVDGIRPGALVSGDVAVNVKVTSSNPIYNLRVWIGNRGGTKEPDYSVENSDSLSFTMSVENLPAVTYIYAVAYDINYNRCQMTIPIRTGAGTETIQNFTAGSPLAYMFTYAVDLDYYNRSGKAEDSSLLVEYAPGRRLDLRNSPEISSSNGMITWQPVRNALGYDIYRKTTAMAEFDLLGSVAGGDSDTFYDYDPLLKTGESYIYAVAPYNRDGEGEQGQTPRVRVLSPFRVNLISPSDGEEGVSLTPAFRWQAESPVGDIQFYNVSVLGNNENQHTFQQMVKTEQSLISPVALNRKTVYQWEIHPCMAGSDYNPASDSYLSQSYCVEAKSSSNGAFQFTTGQ